jgi:hypothetical protein
MLAGARTGQQHRRAIVEQWSIGDKSVLIITQAGGAALLRLPDEEMEPLGLADVARYYPSAPGGMIESIAVEVLSTTLVRFAGREPVTRPVAADRAAVLCNLVRLAGKLFTTRLLALPARRLPAPVSQIHYRNTTRLIEAGVSLGPSGFRPADDWIRQTAAYYAETAAGIPLAVWRTLPFDPRRTAPPNPTVH